MGMESQPTLIPVIRGEKDRFSKYYYCLYINNQIYVFLNYYLLCLIYMGVSSIFCQNEYQYHLFEKFNNRSKYKEHKKKCTECQCVLHLCANFCLEYGSVGREGQDFEFTITL